LGKVIFAGVGRPPSVESTTSTRTRPVCGIGTRTRVVSPARTVIGTGRLRPRPAESPIRK